MKHSDRIMHVRGVGGPAVWAQAQRLGRPHSRQSAGSRSQAHRTPGVSSHTRTAGNHAPAPAGEVVRCILCLALSLLIIAAVAALVLEILGFGTLTQIYSYDQSTQTLQAVLPPGS